MTREPVYAALFALLSGLTSGGTPLFRTATRKLTTFESFPNEDQPGMCMHARTELAERRLGLPIKWTLNIDVYVYVHTGAQVDPSIVPSQILNPLLDAIEAALAVDNILANSCTLGGLVTSCTVSGTTYIYPGINSDDAVAIVPIQIVLAPAN